MSGIVVGGKIVNGLEFWGTIQEKDPVWPSKGLAVEFDMVRSDKLSESTRIQALDASTLTPQTYVGGDQPLKLGSKVHGAYTVEDGKPVILAWENTL